ncbi:MAG: hypothetical protein KGZ55_03500 [Sphingomonadaceae bacterium]|nr:hypothetical protein [Sphingomonadaceae bacterium]
MTRHQAKHKQTFAQRVADPDKATLDGSFVESIVMTAANNERTADDIWAMWIEYVRTCEGYDQSPVFREFCNWNKLAGAGPLS